MKAQKSATQIRRGSTIYDICAASDTQAGAVEKANRIRAAGIAAFPQQSVGTWHVYAELWALAKARDIASGR